MNWKKLLFLPVWLIAVLCVVSAALLLYVFAGGKEETPVAYGVYVLSFYSLTVLTALAVTVIPGQYKALKEKAYSHSMINLYITDPKVRTRVSLYLSLGINLIYIAVNIVSGALYRSAWFAVLAGYYAVLAIMRFLLVRFVNKTGIGKDYLSELKRSRLCGLILMTINLSLSGAVLMIVYQDKGYRYNGILIYIMAMYTFYITVQAIRNVIKYKKYRSPVMSVARVISLSAAMVSMLALETAMLNQFGSEMTPESKYIFIVLTGAGVSIIVFALSVYAVVHSTKEISKLRRSSDGK